jgi:hypothetical protein
VRAARTAPRAALSQGHTAVAFSETSAVGSTALRFPIAMSATHPSKDPLHVDVPPHLVQELKDEMKEDFDAYNEVAEEMVWVLGGDPRCFERFLVARNLSVAAASIMMRDALLFRSQLAPMDEETKTRVAPLWPGCFINRTKDGNPFVVFQLGRIDTRRIMATVTEEEFRAFYIYWMETSLRHQRATGQRKTIEGNAS